MLTRALTRLRTRLRARLLRGLADRRAAVMVEFAVVGPIFFLLLLVVFEVSYDLYLNEVLDTALQATARQIATGTAQPTTASNLISGTLCPNALGLLNCNNLYVTVQRIDTTSTTSCPGGYGHADLWDATNGTLPGTNGNLQLGLYGGLNGTGAGNAVGPPSTCYASSSKNNGFCVAGPSTGSPELIVMSAVYVAPSFLQRLVGNTVTYNGSIVRATLADAAFVTEGYSSSYTGNNGC
jgi:Flp pilus assembly protein TadG